MPATFQSSGHFTLGFLADHSQLASNANVADCGIRKGKGGTAVRYFFCIPHTGPRAQEFGPKQCPENGLAEKGEPY
jgi:hypothetical protein